MKSGLSAPVDGFRKLLVVFEALGSEDVLVGVPQAENHRDTQIGEEPINNAALAYIHNFGAPEARIPARPFMEPGIADAKKEIVECFRKAGVAALNGDKGAKDRALKQAGLRAQRAIQRRIREGIPPPLSDKYLRIRDRKLLARARRQKGMTPELYAAIREAQLGSRTPLYDTGQLLKSITYVIRWRR